MFVDVAKITIKAGKGGDGAVSFRREKFVPKGGPDGGDGGRGGDVVFVVKDNLRTLGHLKLIRSFRAENGRPGQGARCAGRRGNDVEIAVPPGTVIRNAETGEVIKDLTGCDRFVFLEGGRGGLGNWHFRTAVRQTPRFAQPGEPGQEMRVGLELQIIADIGLVGFPNAGKSSLINLFTNARSKVAGYPFTTKIPVLGVLREGDQDVVIADIPGILHGRGLYGSDLHASPHRYNLWIGPSQEAGLFWRFFLLIVLRTVLLAKQRLPRGLLLKIIIQIVILVVLLRT